jgi:peptide deformylase
LKKAIVLWPDPVLTQPAEAVTEFNEELQTLVADLFETMAAANGAGLAAPQIGVLKRVLVVDVSSQEPGTLPIVLINPVLTGSDGTQDFQEGCLSVPGQYLTITRKASVAVSYKDATGADQQIVAEGLMADALQHEMDHLDGVMFTTHVGPVRREMVKRKAVKQKKELARYQQKQEEAAKEYLAAMKQSAARRAEAAKVDYVVHTDGVVAPATESK